MKVNRINVRVDDGDEIEARVPDYDSTTTVLWVGNVALFASHGKWAEIRDAIDGALAEAADQDRGDALAHGAWPPSEPATDRTRPP